MVHDLRNLQTNYTPVLVTNTKLRGGRQNRPSLYADVVCICSPREDSHIKMKEMLVGKLKLNPWGRPMWVCLKLKLTLKGDFCEVSVDCSQSSIFP